MRLDADRVTAFRSLCALEGQRGAVPPTFPEMLFTPLMAEAVLSGAFPWSPLGLIHLHQEVSQHAVLRPGAVCDARVELSAARETTRGIEIDFAMRLTQGAALAWTGLATLLSRARRVSPVGDRAPEPPPAFDGESIEVAADTGLAFARVSGDYNPHHLWRWTARPLGYRDPIAHGMWSFARALSPLLDGLGPDERVEAWATFKRPLFMPGQARLSGGPLSPALRESAFALRDAGSGAPHVVGGVRRL